LNVEGCIRRVALRENAVAWEESCDSPSTPHFFQESLRIETLW
jgi:hypothetical protein